MVNNNSLMNNETRKINSMLVGKNKHAVMKLMAKRIGELSKQKRDSAAVRLVALREYINVFNNIEPNFRRNTVSALNKIIRLPVNKRENVVKEIKDRANALHKKAKSRK